MKLQEALELTALLPLGNTYQIRNADGDRTIFISGTHDNKGKHVVFQANKTNGYGEVSSVEVKITHYILFSKRWTVYVFGVSGIHEDKNELIKIIMKKIDKDTRRRKAVIKKEEAMIVNNGTVALELAQNHL